MHTDRFSYEVKFKSSAFLENLIALPNDLGWENLMLSDGIHGIAQGAVFIVKVQMFVVNRGSNGEISVNHLPILLQRLKNTKFKLTILKNCNHVKYF